nr:MAG TPA: major capsid protein [Caudoviricetes sp.]DAY26314.1 MAG TPA: major capsid protein [Caudoviricetes sp.]
MTTNNNNLPVRVYTPQYTKVLSTIFGVQKAFAGALAPIQTLDGVQHNTKAFMVKTNNTPVVVGTYNADSTKVFGAGTGLGSRFGELKEVVYQDAEVNYDYTLAIHEGIDRYTVNNDLNAAVADRLRLHSEAQTRAINKRIGKFLSANAGETKELAKLDETNIQKLFNQVNVYVTNTEINAPIKCYIRAQVYNAIIDMASTNKSKGSNINLDSNGLLKYKNIELIVVPEQYFENNVVAIFSPDGIVIPFIGIETARTVEAEDFDGVKLQAAAKGGTFVLDDNKKAIIKVTSATPLA